MTVDEDYDVADDTPDLDPITFNARRIHVTQSALDSWGGHPKILQARIRDALLRGGYWRTATGEHLLELGRHQILLSGDGRRCESYRQLPKPPTVPSGPPIDDLVEPVWHREAVVLTPHVVRLFAGKHRVSEDTAADELFGLLDDAVAQGKHYQHNGNHYLERAGFTLALTPDGRTVVSYRTVHAERTPSQVRNNVKSRFRGRHPEQHTPQELAARVAERDEAMSQVPCEQWIPTAQVSEAFSPGRARITAGVISRDRADRASQLGIIRDELCQATSEGRWISGAEGRHILQHAGRQWLIAAHGKGVLACKPPWPAPTADAQRPLPDHGPNDAAAGFSQPGGAEA